MALDTGNAVNLSPKRWAEHTGLPLPLLYVAEHGCKWLGLPAIFGNWHTIYTRMNRRYWDIFDAAFGSVRAAVPRYTGERCPFEGDHQQLMRNHALALGLVQAEKTDFAAFGLVHHSDNHHVVGPWEHYRSLVADASRIPANELVDAAADQGAPWSDWACYMREHYMLVTTEAGE